MNPQDRLIRRLNDEMTLAEKIMRIALRSLIVVLALAVVAVTILLIVEVAVLHVEVAPITWGLFWWLVGFLIVSLVVWVVAAR